MSQGCCFKVFGQPPPFAPCPLQTLQRYYGAIRHRSGLRYVSALFVTFGISLGIPTSASHVPPTSLYMKRVAHCRSRTTTTPWAWHRLRIRRPLPFDIRSQKLVAAYITYKLFSLLVIRYYFFCGQRYAFFFHILQTLAFFLPIFTKDLD